MTAGNVLFITLDQIRWDILVGRLADLVPTPNLDRLVREGVTFENHFTVTLPCGPARASLLTGLYAMNHRSVRNGAPLASHHATIATEARKAGYEPLLFGYTDIPPEPTGMDPADPDLQIYEGIAQGFRELTEMRLETGREWPGYLLSKGYRLDLPDDSKKVPDLFRPVAADGSNRPAINDPALYRAEDSDTAYLANRVIMQLSARVDRPWFAHVTFIRPHPPLVAPEPFNRMVDPATVPAPGLAAPAHPFLDAWFSEPSNQGLFWDFDGNCDGLSAADVAACRAVYLGLVAEVDFHIGRILDWLDATGQRERTLVVVTGDHGEMLGDKRMWGKESVFEPAFHVPLVIRDPRFALQAGKRVSALTESIDVTPTILEFIGREPPPAMDGMALTPFLAGGAPNWRRGVLMEVDLASPVKPTRYQRAWNLGLNACNVSIWREQRWKYVHFNGGIEPMLFDLENDPDETVNLADVKAHAGEIARMRAAMLDRRMERADRRLTGISLGI
jgi:arylsulfatase A-like enzyme